MNACTDMYCKCRPRPTDTLRAGWAEFNKAVAQLGPLKQQTNMLLKPTAFSAIR